MKLMKIRVKLCLPNFRISTSFSKSLSENSLSKPKNYSPIPLRHISSMIPSYDILIFTKRLCASIKSALILNE